MRGLEIVCGVIAVLITVVPIFMLLAAIVGRIISEFKAVPSPSGYHKHRCSFCGFIWEHHDSNDQRHGSEGAHECPVCKRCNWGLGIYDGHLPPQVRSPILPQQEPKHNVPNDTSTQPDDVVPGNNRTEV